MKGAKWVFGWVIVGEDGRIRIPPEAWARYHFRAGDEAIFLPASQKSGGFSISSPAQMNQMQAEFRLGARILGRSIFLEDRSVPLPPEIQVDAGQRLLAVFGSGFALGLLSRGPIYETAQDHPELETF
jgi:hypothetical protein